MSPNIMKRYIQLRTAREIWNALSKAFYDGADETQLFSLNQKAFSLKQMGRLLSIYYGDLVEIFQELDHRDRTIMKDPDDVITYRKSVERLRVHIFLNGLDAEFEKNTRRDSQKRSNIGSWRSLCIRTSWCCSQNYSEQWNWSWWIICDDGMTSQA